MAVELSEKIQLFAICSKFSRLLIDPNRSLISDTLIRKNVELTINNYGIISIKLENLDKDKRIEIFYMEYYRILREILEFLRPNYVLSIHSFTPFYEEDPERKFEVGVLFQKKGKLVEAVLNLFM